MKYRCLERCVDRAPQTRQEGTLIKENTEGKKEKGAGNRKRRRGKTKEVATQHTTQAQTGTTAQGKGEENSAGGRETGTTLEEGEGAAGDVPSYKPTPDELRLREVYGEWVHANSGTHLDGGVCDNSAWQAWWLDLAVMSLRRYDAPSGRVGRRFVGTLG